MKSRVQWPNLRQLTWQTVLGCQQCIQFNPPTRRVGGQQQPIRSSRVGEYLVVDIVGPMLPDRYGRKYAFIAVDHYSRFAMVRMLKHPTGVAAVAILRDLFSQLGVWDWVVSDPGKQFTSNKFCNFLQRQKIQQHLGSPRNYRSTGVVERLARTLKTIAAKFADQNLSAGALTDAVQRYNDTTHSALGTSPFHLFLGHPPVLGVDKILQTTPVTPKPETLAKVRHQYTKSWTTRVNRSRPAFQVGDCVRHYPPRPTYLRHAADRHLHPRATGPLLIIASYPFNRFLVGDTKGHLSVLPSAQLTFFVGGRVRVT